MTQVDTNPSNFPQLELLPGEQLLHEGRPTPAYRTRRLVENILFSTLGLVTLPFLPVFWWATERSVAAHRYWLTDRRLVVRTGLIGYTMRSIPLSRIVDVSVQSSWVDRLFGLTHIQVRDMTGELSDLSSSKGVLLLGVAQPTRWTQAILMRSGGALEGKDEDSSEMVHLLRQLVTQSAASLATR